MRAENQLLVLTICLGLLCVPRSERFARWLRQFNRHFKDRAEPRHAAGADTAAHALREFAHDVQTQTRAAVAARVGPIGLYKALEQALQLIRCDATAGVGDANRQCHTFAPVAAGCRLTYFNADPPLRRKFDRVACEVEHDLAQPGGIAGEYLRQAGINVYVQTQLLGAGQRLQCAAHALKQGGERKRLQIQCKVALFNARHIEHIVDERQQGAGCIMDGARVVQLGAGERRAQRRTGRPRSSQHLAQAQHRIHRRADLVTHVRQKLRLRLARTLGITGGLDELRIARYQLRRQLIEGGHHGSDGVATTTTGAGRCNVELVRHRLRAPLQLDQGPQGEILQQQPERHHHRKNHRRFGQGFGAALVELEVSRAAVQAYHHHVAVIDNQQRQIDHRGTGVCIVPVNRNFFAERLRNRRLVACGARIAAGERDAALAAD